MTPPAAACSGARALKVRGVGLAWDTYGPAPVRQFKPAEPPAARPAARPARRRPWRAEPRGLAARTPRRSHLGQGGRATLGRWLGPISGRPRRAASPLGGVAQPDWGGGSARSGGWLGPIGGVAQPDLAGGWPGGRRLSHPPDRAQTPLTGQRLLATMGARGRQENARTRCERCLAET